MSTTIGSSFRIVQDNKIVRIGLGLSDHLSMNTYIGQTQSMAAGSLLVSKVSGVISAEPADQTDSCPSRFAIRTVGWLSCCLSFPDFKSREDEPILLAQIKQKASRLCDATTVALRN
jgi:hypothetical protein